MTTDSTATGRSRTRWLLGAFAVILAVVVAASYLASDHPDGLERVAEDHGFIDAGTDSPFSIIAGYVFPGLDDGPIATIVAGVIGVVVVFGVVWLLGRVLARRRRSEP